MSAALGKLHLATIAPAVGSPPAASRAAIAAAPTAAAAALAALALPRRAGHTAQPLRPAPRTDGYQPTPPERWSHAALVGRVVELSASRASATLTLAMGLVREAQREGEPVAWVSDDRSGFYPPDAAANGVDLAALAVVRLPHRDAVGVPHQNPAAWALHQNPAARAPHNNSAAARTSAYGNSSIARAAEWLARSGAFGLIVLDLGARAIIPAPLQGRLTQLAQRHAITILCLTEKACSAPSLGSLISLRGQATRRRAGWRAGSVSASGSVPRPGMRSRQQPGKQSGAALSAPAAVAAGAAPDRFVSTLAITKDKRRGPGWSHEEVYRGPPGLR